jgi:hypothetical protein
VDFFHLRRHRYYDEGAGLAVGVPAIRGASLSRRSLHMLGAIQNERHALTARSAGDRAARRFPKDLLGFGGALDWSLELAPPSRNC